MPWWGWALIAVAVVAAVLALLFRAQVLFAMKVAKALSTDKRVPRPLRWALGVALAMKVVPFPDFGIDEVILAVVGLLLVTVYRPTFQAIVVETRLRASEPRATLADPESAGQVEPSIWHPC